MIFAQSLPVSPRDKLQSRLLSLAALFLLLYAAVLTLAPAVRLHSLQVTLRWQHWIGILGWLAAFSLVNRASAQLLPDRDPYLIPIAALLSGWGLLTIYRLDPGFGLRQTAWLVISLAVFYTGLRIPGLLALLRRYKYLELTGGLLLAALTFIFGTYPGGIGPRLWLGCCGVYLQPSEPLKLLLIVYLAAYLAGRIPVSLSLTALLSPTLVLVGAALVILIAQRDLGTATLFIFLYSLIVYVASGRRRIVWISLGFILAAGVTGYLLFDVIRLRVDAWANPWVDPSGRSYQIVQSLISVASGRIFGSGPGLGSPGLVPVAHSDFVFASIAEETGLIGIVALVGLIALLTARGLRTALFATDSYQRYLAAGLTAYLSAQSILIIAGNIRLLPLTGVTLPFVSYGGSSLLTSIFSLLLLCLISSSAEREPAQLPEYRPYRLAGALLFAGLAAIALVGGWWTLVRSSSLLSRADNPRPFIADRYVRRGVLLDRQNRPISTTTGEPGSYTRSSVYVPLSNTAGYTNDLYGQSGLEASQDAYLRGMQGNPASLIIRHRLLYNQPPPGLNLRLSLDLDLQALVDGLLANHKGAAVLLNAASGEVLVMASHPYIDPNNMDTQWEDWLADPSAPMLNRATQGLYSIGSAGAPFLLAQALQQGSLPNLPSTLSTAVNAQSWNCASPVPQNATWEWALANGCPAALAVLEQRLGAARVRDTFIQMGFNQPPSIPLPVTAPTLPESLSSSAENPLLSDAMQISPLQMALAAAALNQGGQQPQPQIVMAAQTPQGWVVLPSGETRQTLPKASLESAAMLLAVQNQPYWAAQGSSTPAANPVSWFVGGTLPNVQGVPLALAVVLEEDNPLLAQQIGLALLQAASQP